MIYISTWFLAETWCVCVCVCVCNRLPVQQVCTNYEVVVFQPRTVTPPYLGSFAYCYTFKLGLPPHLFLPFYGELFSLLFPTASASVVVHRTRHGKIGVVYITSGRSCCPLSIRKKNVDKIFNQNNVGGN